MRSTLILLFIGFSTVVNSQIEEIRRITEQLCSPEFHGRGYVNHGDSIAAAYLVEEFKKIGAEAYGDGFYQDFQLSVNTFPGAMALSQGEKQLVPGLHFSINPSSKGGQYSMHPTEVSAAQILDLDYMRALISEILRVPNSQIMVFNFLGASKDTVKQILPIMHEIAQLMPVAELVDKKFTWSVGREQLYFPYFQIQDSVYQKGVQLEMNVDAKVIENYQTQNVIAYLPAKKKCKETIVFTAHYDHLGRMGADTHFPGANDNASGTAMLLTMAKYFKEHPSKYNILFIAFAGEEAGLVGSKFYTEHPLLKLKKIKFLVNLDIMGSGEHGVTVVNGTLFKKEFDLLQKINKELDLLAKVKIRGPAANSDHYWFTEKGVPAIFIYTMGQNSHYHDIFDTYEELSFAEYADITKLLIEFVKRM
ncbi:MAG: M20/M25/M40 family metallo-hydrolase [Fluviicola sp.]|nr:M20/M25/M40 family metallo-hydrolase [Fluviicola sp.]PHQ99925.1 MAG: aminopeptidase [Marinosulfonomonas sp.]